MPAAASYLFVPATRLDRVDTARASAAHEVIVDLEDAVAEEEKAAAREALTSVPDGRPIMVRVNARSTPSFEDDLRVTAGLAVVAAVVVPKVESPEDVAAARAALPAHVPVIALVESARGIVAAEAIAGAGTARIMFGVVDYTADLGVQPSPDVLAYPRSRLVVASRAAALPPPVDGPTLVTTDERLVRAEAGVARALGMGGKLCIHPKQVAVVNEVFASSSEDVAWAGAVLTAAEAHGGGAFSFEGSMVDAPVIARARRILGADPERPSDPL